ncbi:sensor histidine kinase [Rhodococcus sp. NPDC059968]|uniref:sensor histidine kinase n=1 Tax=Rhodococcus sp. NPDC059968 TaxID=3347017 RepID=UPI00366AEC0D
MHDGLLNGSLERAVVARLAGMEQGDRMSSIFVVRNRSKSPWRPQPERVIVVLRAIIVAGMAALVIFGSPINRTNAPLATVTLICGAIYAGAVLIAGLQGRRIFQDLTTVLDAALTSTLIAATGGADSLMVAVLPLAILAAAATQGLRRAVVAAFLTGSTYTTVVFLTPRPVIAWHDKLEAGLWWSGCLVVTAVLAGILKHLLDAEHNRLIDTRAEALADRIAIEEERDLRARLLASQQAKDDGLRVVIHEFRTPVSSLAALARSLETLGRLTPDERERAIALISAHAVHLSEMLEGLADSAVQTGDPRGAARIKDVALKGLAEQVWDAASKQGMTGTVHVDPIDAVVRCDVVGLRRVLTNLVENAHLHGGDSPVELDLVATPNALMAQVRDRGPGIALQPASVAGPGRAGVGDQAGKPNLGLWIVEQVVSGMNGTFSLSDRPGGGLVARVVIPIH